MYGLVFEILEEFVLAKQNGRELWHTIKAKAHCGVADQGFLRRSHYGDDAIQKLLEASSDVLKVDMADLLVTFGKFMIRHHYQYGYDELLRANGATLRQWLSNLNSLHDHVSKSFASHEVNFQAPIYWCEDCDQVEASILLHYYSFRGTWLAPMTVGIVQELAQFQFGVDVTLTQLALQGVKEAEFTTWRITATDTSQRWKLSPTVSMDDLIDFSQMELPEVCPYSGRSLSISSVATSAYSLDGTDDEPARRNIGLSYEQLRTIFPFHVLVDRQFTILQVGHSLPTILSRTEDSLHGLAIGDVLDIIRPVMGGTWDWQALKKLEDQHFFLVPAAVKKRTPASALSSRRQPKQRSASMLRRKVSMAGARIKFKGSMLEITPTATNGRSGRKKRTDDTVVMFVLTPDARNVAELRSMGLTMDDLPLHTSQRDAVFLGEYIGQEVDMANNLDKLSKKLAVEKNLSNSLLYNMLPRQIADDLRSGRTVEPQHHDQVTLFFSDVVGFTPLSAQVDPWAVIDLLNRLYSVMDFLAAKFNLYKVETIGDAYMAACGLPTPNEHHVENIANFAIAVLECVKHVLSPVDGKPIELRIGIHTGSCTAGVVGTMTPHYCLFGDMVNVTARHESTGLAGKIQCSSELFARLTDTSKYNGEPHYNISARGLVNMKGKGDRMTYLLQGGTQANPHAGHAAVQELYQQVGDMLQTRNWKRRIYFRSSGALRGDDMDSSFASGSSNRTLSTTAMTDASTTYDGFAGTDHSPTIIPLESDTGSDGSHVSENERSIGDNGGLMPDESIHAMTTPITGLANLVFGSNLSREELVSQVYMILSPLLRSCLSDDSQVQRQDKELLAFVEHISMAFQQQNAYHNFRRTVHVVAWANYLFLEMQENGAGRKGAIDTNPSFRFTLLMAALLRDCKHISVAQSQLQDEEHLLYEMHVGDHCQARFSFRYGLDTMSDKFPDLYDDIVLGFPSFLYLMKKLESPKISSEGGGRKKLKETLAAMSVVFRLASLGHFALENDDFFKWNEAAFAELRLADLAHRGSDPTPSWNDQCMRYVQRHVLPLVKECGQLLPNSTSIKIHDAVVTNLTNFEAQAGAKYPRRSSLDESDLSSAHNIMSAAVEVFR